MFICLQAAELALPKGTEKQEENCGYMILKSIKKGIYLTIDTFEAKLFSAMFSVKILKHDQRKNHVLSISDYQTIHKHNRLNRQ